MWFSIRKRQTVATTLQLLSQLCPLAGSTSTTSTTCSAAPPVPTFQQSNATCEYRTINYITHSLPQQCLKSSWHDVNGMTLTQTEGGSGSTAYAEIAEVRPTGDVSEQKLRQGSEVTQGDAVNVRVAKETAATVSTTTEPLGDLDHIQAVAEEDPAFGDATFISFEDWKQQNLEKVGQNLDIGERRQKPGSRDRDSVHHALDTFGDEGEISLGFMGFTGQGQVETSTASNAETGGSEAQKTPAVKPRSKDAGTTCKERFNYASFDAGATIKKANPEAKSATKILSENKDGYMLNICSASNKFFIVELSDDILVDTVVLANFEFFSSQFRQFRVSVSDRYPVKLDRWVELGTYEAQNARGIQAFLVEEPKIWARYLKVEILTHYGKEYYCPVSLVRVHGRTMISEFRAEEEAARGEADGDEENESSLEEAGEKMMPEAEAAVVIEEKLAEQLKGAQAASDEARASEASATNVKDPEPPVTPWPRIGTLEWPFEEPDFDVCLPSEVDATFVEKTNVEAEPEKDNRPLIGVPGTTNAEEVVVPTAKNEPPSESKVASSLMDKLSKTVADMKESVKARAAPSVTSRSENSTTTTVANNMTTKPSQTHPKSNSTATTSPLPTPSTQESFFKTVHKRLHFLEANSTLSLQYIESQSALLRDAFHKVEKRLVAKSTEYLKTLNETVMNELRYFQEQYDQMLQSTVIELESQKEKNEREILEVSRRMTLLADEIIFQKRMSIVQSLVLLLCLGLVLFSSRGPQRAYLELPMGSIRDALRRTSADMNDNRYASLTPNSMISTPGAGAFPHREMNRSDSGRANSPWDDSNQKRTKFYDSLDEGDLAGRSSAFEDFPSTPYSMRLKPLPEISSSSPHRRDPDDQRDAPATELDVGDAVADPSNSSPWAPNPEKYDNQSRENGYLRPIPRHMSLKHSDNNNVENYADHQHRHGYESDASSDRVAVTTTNTNQFQSRTTAIKNGSRIRLDLDHHHQSYYATPPPEDDVAPHQQSLVRKPLPALPVEVDEEEDDESDDDDDEDTTGISLF